MRATTTPIPTLIARNSRYAGNAIATATIIAAAISSPVVPFTRMDILGSMDIEQIVFLSRPVVETSEGTN
jgi:hypothetical protein